MYEYRALCNNVVDGDTVDLVIDLGFKIKYTERIRLLGVEAPEKGQAGYLEAKQFVLREVLGRELLVKTEKKDKYGRYLGVLFVDGVNINEELIAQNLATVYK